MPGYWGQFIPSKQISQLRAERYQRVQFEGESLATCVESIKDAALVLRTTENEAQVVERIVEGITPINVPDGFFKLHLPPFCNWSIWQ